MIRSSILSLALVAATATAASAQWYPGGQQGYNGSQQGYYNGRSVQARGVVTSYNWYDLQLQTTNGRNAYVRLHQGTIINPRGTTLRSGMPVRVIGFVDSNGTLEANEVDVVNGSCAYGNRNYNGNYNGNVNANGRCNSRYGRGGDADDRRDNDDNQGNRDEQNRGNQYQYPSPYQTYPPNR